MKLFTQCLHVSQSVIKRSDQYITGHFGEKSQKKSIICTGLHEIIEGKMNGKPTRGRRRIQMVHDLANDGGFAEDREGGMDGEREREKECQKPAVQQKTTNDDDLHWYRSVIQI